MNFYKNYSYDNKNNKSNLIKNAKSLRHSLKHGLNFNLHIGNNFQIVCGLRNANHKINQNWKIKEHLISGVFVIVDYLVEDIKCFLAEIDPLVGENIVDCWDQKSEDLRVDLLR